MLMNVYSMLPVWGQNLVCTLRGVQIQLDRYAPSFDQILAEVYERTFWSEAEIQTFRNQRLAAFVDSASQFVPYYKSLFAELNLRPTEIGSLEELVRLPFLTKATVQEDASKFLAQPSPRRLRLVSTSGTTGAGLRFWSTQQALQEQWAVWWRYRRWHGIERGTWCAHFSGSMIVPISQTKPPFWRYNYPGRQIFFSGYHLSPKNMDYYIEEMNRRKPPWIHGYPSMIALLAAHILESRKRLEYPIRWITIGAEGLLPHQRDLIEQAFGVRPIQHYGMAEAVANISECPKGKLHVDEDFAAVEFVPVGAQQYRIIGTNLSNLATPLLRYDTRDIARISDSACDCGRPGRIVDSIDGRQEDYIVLKNGARIAAMNRVFKDFVNIREAQIYQEKPGEVVFRVVKSERYTMDDEHLLRQAVRERLGDDTVVHIEYIDAVQRTANGKVRLVVSDIREGKL